MNFRLSLQEVLVLLGLLASSRMLEQMQYWSTGHLVSDVCLGKVFLWDPEVFGSCSHSPVRTCCSSTTLTWRINLSSPPSSSTWAADLWLPWWAEMVEDLTMRQHCGRHAHDVLCLWSRCGKVKVLWRPAVWCWGRPTLLTPNPEPSEETSAL